MFKKLWPPFRRLLLLLVWWRVKVGWVEGFSTVFAFTRRGMVSSFQIVVQVEGGEPQAYTFGGGGLLLGDSDTAGLRVPGWRAEHLQVVVAVDRLEVDPCDHAEGVLVNGYPIDGAVCVEYPAILTFGRTAVWVLVPDDVGGSAEAARPLDAGTLVPETWHAPADRRPSTDTAATIAPVRKSVFEARTRIIASMATPTLHSQETIPVRGTAGASGGGREGREEHPPDSAAIDGRYRLSRQIARGGMGRIYEGVELRLKRRVAVKVSTLGDAGNLRFVREAEILASLAHPNIVPIHGFGVDTFGRACYTMKLIKGRTLQAILDGLRHRDAELMRQFTRDRLLDIFRKVCDAMAFSHAANIIHRDLKPENVMVGEFGEVQLMDWGLAKEVGGVDHVATTVRLGGVEPADFGRTLEGEVMGTPQYMSPEQAEGRVMELDVRSDIYSLGAVLYAVLTLRAPVDGGTVEEVLTKVKRGEITSMVSPSTQFRHMRLRAVVAARRMHGNVPDALQAVVRRAMHLRPAGRYQSVSELSADIEAYQGGFATRAERAGFFRQVFLLLRRNRTVAIAHVVVIAVCGYFLSRIIVGERRALEGAQVAERQAVLLREERDAAREALTRANAARPVGGRHFAGPEPERVVEGYSAMMGMRLAEFVDGAGRMVRISVGSRERRLEVLDVEASELSLPSDSAPVPVASSMATSLCGRVVVASGEELTVFDQNAGRLARKGVVSLPSVPLQMVVSPEGGWLWTGRRFVDLANGIMGEPVFRDGVGGVYGARASSVWLSETELAEVVLVRDGSLAGVSDEGRRAIAVWRVGQAEAVRRVFAPEALCLANCAIEGVIVEGGTDRCLRVRNRETLEVLRVARVHEEQLLDVASHPRRPVVATCAEDFTVKVWDVADLSLIGEIRGFKSVPVRIAFHPDGKGIAVTVEGNRVQIFRPKFLAD
jgi:serine/threonine protein kinase